MSSMDSDNHSEQNILKSSGKKGEIFTKKIEK